MTPVYLDASLFLQVANQRNGLEVLGDVASNELSAGLYTVGLLPLTDELLCIRCEIWSVKTRQCSYSRRRIRVSPNCCIRAVQSGTQDIVLGSANYSDGRLILRFWVSFGDCLGRFTEASGEITYTVTTEPKGYGVFSVTSLNGGLCPNLAYVFQDKADSTFCSASVNGTCYCLLSPSPLGDTIASGPLPEITKSIPTDLSGTGMGGWLL
jgi:hypothetical protein